MKISVYAIFNGKKRTMKNIRGRRLVRAIESEIGKTQVLKGLKEKNLVKRLKKLPLGRVKFIDSNPRDKKLSDGSTIIVEYDGRKLKNKIEIMKHLGYVGAFHTKRNMVSCDDDLTDPKEQKTICVHETIEKYVSKKYGLDIDIEAHEVATAIERKFAKRIGVNWLGYNRRVAWIHDKESKETIREW